MARYRLLTLLAPLLLLVACGPRESAIRITDAWARETPEGALNGAVYLVIENDGAGADRLVEISTPRARTAHLHETRRDDGMARMRGIGTLEIPPHATVTLAPGGLHIMLMGLERPLVPGDTLPLRLRFLKAGEMEVAVAIRALAGS